MSEAQTRFTFAQLQIFTAFYTMGGCEAHRCLIENSVETYKLVDFYDPQGCHIGSVGLDDLYDRMGEDENINLWELLFEPRVF